MREPREPEPRATAGRVWRADADETRDADPPISVPKQPRPRTPFWQRVAALLQLYPRGPFSG